MLVVHEIATTAAESLHTVVVWEGQRGAGSSVVEQQWSREGSWKEEQ